jgi:hypothetical protein
MRLSLRLKRNRQGNELFLFGSLVVAAGTEFFSLVARVSSFCWYSNLRHLGCSERWWNAASVMTFLDSADSVPADVFNGFVARRASWNQARGIVVMKVV